MELKPLIGNHYPEFMGYTTPGHVDEKEFGLALAERLGLSLAVRSAMASQSSLWGEDVFPQIVHEYWCESCGGVLSKTEVCEEEEEDTGFGSDPHDCRPVTTWIIPPRIEPKPA